MLCAPAGETGAVVDRRSLYAWDRQWARARHGLSVATPNAPARQGLSRASVCALDESQRAMVGARAKQSALGEKPAFTPRRGKPV
jgi:hypothetical protein